MGKQIQWFPGHMARALRQIKEQLKTVDLVIVISDARAPLSALNPDLFTIIKDKPRLMVLSKKDLANPVITDKWISYFIKEGYTVAAFNLMKDKITASVLTMIKVAMSKKIAKDKAKGIKTTQIRAMVVGIPNVGKSTFINQMAKRKASKVGNLPGVTKAQQLIKISSDCELVDTPGVLWPKFEIPETGIKLALIGTIKNEILPADELVLALLKFMQKQTKNSISEYYQIGIDEEINYETVEKILKKVGQRRGLLKIQGEIDLDKAQQLLLKEFREGFFGSFSMEEPGDFNG